MAAPIFSSRPGIVVKSLIRSYSTCIQKIVKRSIDELKGCNDLNRALSMFHELIAMTANTKPCPSVSQYASVLACVSKMEHHSSVVYMYTKMSEQGVKRNTYTMSTCINSFCRLKNVDLGLSLFGSMIKCGLKPNVVTYTNLTRCLLLEDRFQEALYFGVAYHHIVGINQPFDVGLSNTLVEVLCKSGQVFKAVLYMRHLNNNSVGPTSIMCNIIIAALFDKSTGVIMDGVDDLLSKSGALEIFIQLLTSEVRPVIATYNKLIEELFRINRCDDAKTLFNVMKAAKKTPKPNNFTCEIFLNGLLDNNLIEDALSFPALTTEDPGLLHNDHIFIYNVLLNGLCRNKKLDQATEVFNGLSSLKGIQPDVETYTIMIGEFLEMGMSSEAKELIVKMENKDYFPSESTCNIIVHGLLQLNETAEAIKFVREMVSRGFTLSVSNLSMVVNLVPENCMVPL